MKKLIFSFSGLVLSISILTLIACKSDSEEPISPKNCALVKVTNYTGLGTEAETSVWYLKPECNPVANQGIYITSQGGVAPAGPFLSK